MTNMDKATRDETEDLMSSLEGDGGIDRPSSDSTRKNLQCNMPSSVLVRILQGVAVATKASEHHVKTAAEWLTPYDAFHDGSSTRSESRGYDAQSDSTILSLQEGYNIVSGITIPFEVRQLASLTVAVAFLRESSRRGIPVTTHDLNLVWGLIHSALTHPQQTRPICSASRSAQGFLAVPLCSLVKDGNIDELFRLHVWMPDGQRGNRDFALHSHQPFAQSWILAGVGTDRTYEVSSVTDFSLATHAEYALAWNDGSTQSTTYKTHQISSTVVNTHRLVFAKQMSSALNTRDATYYIPAASFHTTEVEPATLHATLFYFDSSRGFEKDARVLGPKDVESSVQIRDPNGITSQSLAEIANVLRSCEQHQRQGQQHAEYAELEYAVKEFDIALNIIDTANESISLAYHRQLILGALGVINRRLGRYERAKDYLEQALVDMKPCHARIELSGDLCVVYRHMDLLEDVKSASEIQYTTAAELGFASGMCRAIGTLGMVNYQLSLKNNDEGLLKLAIEQLTERVESARSITASLAAQETDRKIGLQKANFSIIREFIGLSRLSLCYTAIGNLVEARAKALESLNLTRTLNDPTDIGMSRFFYGRALLKSGQRDEALKQFNLSEGCSPATILCQEPSEENRGYLQELVEAGIDIDLIDEQGYTPLDYTVFSDDKKGQKIVIDGLRRILQSDVEQQVARRLKQANILKGYRELFQERLRPVLLRGGDKVFQTLRSIYAKELATDEEKRNLYDGFKFIWYADFLKFGRLPRSTHNLTNQYVAEDSHKSMPEFVIFFSYRWINNDFTISSPDDRQNTQYNRMIAALEKFFEMHPETVREKLGIWMDFACIDQDDPASGVLALPLNLALCNSVISLMDDTYESRAWCSVEALLADTLRGSYHQHTWYSQVPTDSAEDGSQIFDLRNGQADLTIPMSAKLLSFEEEDRPKVVFLERQRHLLGQN